MIKYERVVVMERRKKSNPNRVRAKDWRDPKRESYWDPDWVKWLYKLLDLGRGGTITALRS